MSRRTALLVGINDYGPDSGMTNLEFAEADAELMATTLRESCGFETRLLRGRQASLRQIIQALRVYYNEQDLDTFLFYFSGHGEYIREIGAQLLHCHGSQAGETMESLNLNEWTDRIANVPARHYVLILDACRNRLHAGVTGRGSAPGLEPMLLSELQSRVGSRDIRVQAAGSGAQERLFFMLLACSAHQRSFEHSEVKHGIFTHALAEEIRTRARTHPLGLISRKVGSRTRQWYLDKKVQELQLPQWIEPGFDYDLFLVDDPVPADPDIVQRQPTLPPPQPKIENTLISIPEGTALLGANRDFVDAFAGGVSLSSEKLRQFSLPAPEVVHLQAYRISRLAVSNDEYGDFVKATGWREPPSWTPTKGAAKPKGDWPVVQVTFDDAEAFCQWKQARLPSNLEWERAARGPEGRVYPWGDRWPASEFPCNCDEHHEATGHELMSVSSFGAFSSSEGVLNMAGNVWEWVDGGDGERKHTRGGSWQAWGPYYCVSWFRLPTDKEVMDADVGFRYVLADALPSTPPAELHGLSTINSGTYSVGLPSQRVAPLVHALQAPRGSAEWFSQHPTRAVSVARVQMRRYLVTNEEYYEFVQKTGYPWPQYWSKDILRLCDRPFLDKYRFHPVTGVTYRDAVAFCSWHGGRLPTNDEWEVATRGDESWLYPWGNNFDDRRANFLETGLARTSRVDEFPTNASPFGILDSSGNVKEWTAMEPSGGHFVRGGAFHEQGSLYGLAFLRTEADPDVTRPYIGFRYVLGA